MKAVHVVILALALLVGANALTKHRQINRQVLEARLGTFLAPGFRSEIEDDLRRFLDTKVRNVIINGDPEHGIPVLDPQRVEHFDIDIAVDGVRLKGSVDNVVIRGAANFTVESVRIDDVRLIVEVEVSLEEARVEGEHYKLEGAIIDEQQRVEGEGPFDADVRRIGEKVRVELGVREDESVEVRGLELDVSLGEARVNLENLLGGGILGNTINKLISRELPGFVERNKGPVLEKISEEIRKIANEKLVGVTLGDLVNIIKGDK